MQAAKRSTITEQEAARREVGGRLRDAREAMDVDLERAEREIFIPAGYLSAIESGDWSGLPSDIYVYGYIKTYESYLGFEQGGMRKLLEPSRPSISVVSETPRLRKKHTSFDVRPLLTAGAVLLVGFVLAFMFWSIPPAPLPKQVSAIPASLAGEDDALSLFDSYGCLQADASADAWRCYAGLRFAEHDAVACYNPYVCGVDVR